jgi:hypothetical protein
MTEIALSPKNAAVPLLARGASTDAVGEQLGVNGRTVRRWREDPEFEAEIEAARKALLSESVACLTAAVRKAAEVATELLDDPSPAIRVRAVSEVFRALPILSEHAALEARIAALEARLEEKDGPSWQAA